MRLLQISTLIIAIMSSSCIHQVTTKAPIVNGEGFQYSCTSASSCRVWAIGDTALARAKVALGCGICTIEPYGKIVTITILQKQGH